jgi:hypothetical protein
MHAMLSESSAYIPKGYSNKFEDEAVTPRFIAEFWEETQSEFHYL